MMLHARAWQHAQSIHPDELPDKIALGDYAVPILGRLASDPKVSSKDVIKAAAQAAADGKIAPSRAVELIGQIPEDADKVRPWLRGLYAANLSAIVHMKAAALGQPQPAPQPPQSPPPGPPA